MSERPTGYDGRQNEIFESTPREIREPITPQSLIADGSSTETYAFAMEWDNSQRARDLVALIGCSDARFAYDPTRTIGIRSISASVPSELYGPRNVLSRDFGTQLVVVAAHHDGTTVQPGVRPQGCGGREEKAKMKKTSSTVPLEGAARFVDRHVVHEDPLIGAVVSTMQIAEKSGLPSLGITQDHTTGEFLVLNAAIPTRRGGIEHILNISLSKLIHGQYREEDVYAERIPQLEEHQIPDEFIPFLRRQRLYMEELRNANPHFTQNQLVQNPDTILLTSVIRSSRGRFPRLSGESTNRIFSLTVARRREDTSGDVDEQSMLKALDQLEYPIEHAQKSNGDPSLPFSSLANDGTVIVETRDLDLSRRLAEKLLQKEWFHDWRWQEHDQNRIIVAETTKGIVDHAEWFPNTLVF